MDSVRLFLYLSLGLVLFLLWETWQQDYGTPPPPATSPQTAVEQRGPEQRDVPSAPQTEAPTDTGLAKPLESGQRIRVTTDVLNVELDTRGGDVRRLELLRYPVSLDKPEQPFRLMNDVPPYLFIAQSGLRSESSPAPTHHDEFTNELTEYRLAEGAGLLEVPLKWSSPEGVVVTKKYIFYRNRYVIDLEHRVENKSQEEWRGRLYRQLQRTPVSITQVKFLYTYTGGVIYSPEEKYEKISFDDMAERPLERDIDGGWAAMIQHYFLGSWVPNVEELNHYYSKVLEQDRYVLGLISPETVVASGATGILSSSRLVVGPKIQDRLAEVAPGLELTVDYGWLTFISKPLFWLLKWIDRVIGNWGWSIIVLTILVKLAFYKLSETSYKSMANMRRLQPQLQNIRERYGEDRQRMNQAMMALYKKEKVNPLGGCLPIVVQIPVFIALYWVLVESVELRQSPFILWIRDLSQPDPFFVLPLLMGVTMLVQQKLSPPLPDPVQAKVMMMLPVAFTVFFLFFPAGLVLYWTVNNALSIAQQWYITYRIQAGMKPT
jgi:membrane protein insertase, YidC/Oxa1 family, N-terminal domain